MITKLNSLLNKMVGGSSLAKLRVLISNEEFEESLELSRKIPQTTASSNQARLELISLLISLLKNESINIENGDIKTEVKTDETILDIENGTDTNVLNEEKESVDDENGTEVKTDETILDIENGTDTNVLNEEKESVDIENGTDETITEKDEDSDNIFDELSEKGFIEKID